MSLRLRLILSFMIIITLVTTVGVATMITLDNIDDAVDTANEQTAPYALVLSQDRGNLYALLSLAEFTLTVGNGSLWNNNAPDLLDELRTTPSSKVENPALSDPALEEEIANLYESMNTLTFKIEDVVMARLDGESETSANLLFAAILSEVEETLLPLEALVERLEEDFEADSEIAEENLDRGDYIMIGGSVLTIFASIIIALLTIRTIFPPLRMIEQGTVRFGAGNLAHRIPLDANNELGKLAKTFNQMADSLQQRETDLREQKDVAERANQIKSAFLASMSHELRTPLNAIINFTMFVAEGVLGPVNEEQKDNLTEAIDSANHLLALINDVLDISKIETGSLNLFVEDDLNFKGILDDVVATTKILIKDRPVTLVTDIDPALPPIRGDRQRLYQIILNIMSNACKFTNEGEIKLSVHAQNGNVNITVKDNGPGIAADEHHLVFESFKQTDAGLRRGSGTGLGMPISKSLAEAHGGKLWFESEAGQGATFFVTLPLKSDRLTPTMAPKKPTASLNSEGVLA